MSVYSEKRKEMLKNFTEMKDRMICKIDVNYSHFGADGFFELYMRNGGITYISSLKKGGTVEDFCYFSQDDLKNFLRTKEGKTIRNQIKEFLIEEIEKL